MSRLLSTGKKVLQNFLPGQLAFYPSGSLTRGIQGGTGGGAIFAISASHVSYSGVPALLQTGSKDFGQFIQVVAPNGRELNLGFTSASVTHSLFTFPYSSSTAFITTSIDTSVQNSSAKLALFIYKKISS